MSRLDQEHDVVALARELGLRGDPVEAVVRFCEEKIGCWAEDFGGVETVAALEQLVADHLQLVFEEVCSDDDLEQIIAKYVALGEYVFATLRDEFGPTTFGLTVKRKRCGPESGDKYVAVIDCRGEKAEGGGGWVARLREKRGSLSERGRVGKRARVFPEGKERG